MNDKQSTELSRIPSVAALILCKGKSHHDVDEKLLFEPAKAIRSISLRHLYILRRQKYP